MRKISILVFSLFCIAASMQAQRVRVITDIINGKHYANSAGDSVLAIPVIFTGDATTYPGLTYGQYPDSIRLSISITDSTSGYVAFKSLYSLSRVTYVQRDTIYTVQSYGSAKDTTLIVPFSQYRGKSLFGVAYNATATLNGVLTTHKVWLRAERFFTATR